MEKERISELEITYNKTKLSWYIADKWFRVLEFSFVLGALHYFNERLEDNIAITIIYWMSWVFFWGWFEDTGNYIAELINTKKSFLKTKELLFGLSVRFL